MLLGENLWLKVADFGCSSLKGSLSLVRGGPRCYRHGWTAATTSDMDFFALGSTIFEIMTGRAPYEERNSKEAGRLFDTNVYPSLSDVPGAQIIERCWLNDIRFAEEVLTVLKTRLV
jgi:hypothetical protein